MEVKLTLPRKYESESVHLGKAIASKHLSRNCVRLEQLKSSRHSVLLTEASKSIEQATVKEVFFTGSTAEGLKLHYHTSEISSGDTDIIILVQKFNIVKTPKHDQIYVVMKEDEHYPGYVKLQIPPHLTDHEDFKNFTRAVPDGVFLTGNKSVEVCTGLLSSFAENVERHGPALTLKVDESTVIMFLQEWLNGKIDSSWNITSKDQFYNTDLVLCHYYSGWPKQAEDWIARESSSTWPSKNLKTLCVDKGCILAPVGPKGNPDSDIFWRISFNQAEQFLIESFNETQLHCFMLLKLLNMETKKTIPGKNITSYIMKTTMFWCMEKIGQSEWRPENLIQCFVACLELLRKWISKRFMPNYFIRERNMFVTSELTDRIASQLTDMLGKTISDPWKEIKRHELLKAQLIKEERVLDLEVLKADIVQYIATKTDLAMAGLLCKTNHTTITAKTEAERWKNDFRVFIKCCLGVLYAANALPRSGDDPGDCLGLISKVLDENGGNVGPEFIKVCDIVLTEKRFMFLDKYRQIIDADDLTRGDHERTIDELKRAADGADRLGHELADYFHRLRRVVRKE